MASKHLLSKSTFMYGCQCPKRLYLHKFKDEVRNPEDEQENAIFASGINVDALSRDLFTGGVSAEPPDSFSYHIAVEKTQQYIAEGQKVIYQAAFNYEGVMCAIDMIVQENNKWYAYEVKGTNSLKPPHIMDASLQHYVITKSGLPLEDISIVHLNKEYVRIGALEVSKLFTTVSVFEQAKENELFISQKIAEFKKLITDKKEPVIAVGNQCEKPYPCDFTNYCWSNIALPETPLGNNNHDKKSLKEFLSDLVYPLYFFDFETVMQAVPPYDYSRSWQSLPIQYSLHVQKSPGTEVEHYEFLGDGVNDSREDLIKQLISQVRKKGSILVWYQSFEITRLRELARDFPKYADELNAIIDRIVDLIVPFKKKWYELPEFHGSASLKAVLPVMVPELSYEDLEIQEGGSASYIYSELKNQTQEVQAEQRRQLLAYCQRDTLACVEILKKLQSL